ncbi:MAG: LPS export ABC transporter ATP-binding protein [Spirochaetota bacterium]|nr:LPS export ABC transporter ATP-binding protein [Spirochaetota bacterium]
MSSTRQKLVVRNIEKTYKKRKVVKGVSFYMTEGEVIGLLGPNGAGKTTSFYMVVGLVFPESGGIFLDNLEITHFPMYQRSKLGIGYLAQEASVFRKLSVEDNIMAILEIQDISRDEKNARLEELLVELDITHIRRSYGFQLSGGERRRTEIARALASNPSFLLLDEPFAGVDPIAVQEIQRIIVKLKAKGIGVLITDHNARETLKITDRSYILADGLIRYYGTARELAENDEVKKVYLGDEFTL